MENTRSTELIKIFNNEEKMYEGGDLWYYAKKLFFARNVKNGFHGHAHMMHVICEVYDAIKVIKIGQYYARALMIAAMFHDYGHTGDGTQPDSINIQKAIKGIKRHIHPADKKYIKDILILIRSTEWMGSSVNTLFEKHFVIDILRDADMSFMFTYDWMQYIIFGLSTEKNVSPREILQMQRSFLENHVKFYSSWGKEKFGSRIPARIEEMKLLEEKFLVTTQQ